MELTIDVYTMHTIRLILGVGKINSKGRDEVVDRDMA